MTSKPISGERRTVWSRRGLAAAPDLVQESFLTSITGLKAQAAEIKQGIAAHIAADADLQSGLERLMTIPAVGPKTATRMLLMLRTRSFDSARQAAAFLGLVPIERASGTNVRGRPSLSRAGNPRLRAALYMAAVVGIRKNPTSRPSTSVCSVAGSARWPHSGPPCASSSLSVSVC